MGRCVGKSAGGEGWAASVQEAAQPCSLLGDEAFQVVDRRTGDHAGEDEVRDHIWVADDFNDPSEREQ